MILALSRVISACEYSSLRQHIRPWLLLLLVLTAEAAGQSSAFVRTFISIPDDSAKFVRMFGRSPTAPELKRLTHYHARWHRLIPDASLLTQADQVYNQIRHGSEPVAVVIAHNEMGSLKLVGGNPVGIDELVSAAEEADKILIILSCQSRRFTPHGHFGVIRDLTYEEAIDVSALLNRALDNDELIGRLKSSQSAEARSMQLELELEAIMAEADSQLARNLLVRRAGGGVMLATGPVAAVIIQYDERIPFWKGSLEPLQQSPDKQAFQQHFRERRRQTMPSHLLRRHGGNSHGDISPPRDSEDHDSEE